MKDETGTKPAKGGRARRLGMALFAFTARSLQQVATFVITLLAARFLLPADYGVYALAIVFITLIQTLTYTGYYQWIINAKAEDVTVLDTAFWMIFGLATTASLALALAAWPISLVYESGDLFGVLLLLAAIQPVAGSSAWYSAALLRRGKVNVHFGIMFAQNLASLVGGAFMLWLWQSLYALVAFRYLRVLSGALLYLIFSPDRPGLRFDRQLARQSTGFSGGLYGARFLNFLSRYAGDLLLGLMFTTAEAGLYRFGNRVAGGATDIITQPMQSFALTQFGKASRDDQDLAGTLRRFVGSVTLLTGIVAAVVIVLAPEVVADFFNPGYLAAIGVTFAMAIRSFFNVGRLILEPALAARHRTGLVARFNFIWTVITVAVVFATSPFGLSMLAWGQVAVMACSTLAAFVILEREGIRTSRAWRNLAVSAMLAAAYGLALHLLWPVLQGWIVDDIAAIAAGLALASMLAAFTLAVGSALQVFTLSVFSG